MPGAEHNQADVSPGPVRAGKWREGAPWPQTASVVFVADDLGAWLVGLLADAGRKKLIAVVIGSDQESALRKAADDAAQDTAAEMRPSAEQARQLVIVIRKAFPQAGARCAAGWVSDDAGIGANGVARQLAMLDSSDRAAARRSSAEVLEMPGAALAEKLTGHVVREILLRGSGGGPLAPLADQLNHDLTRLGQGCVHGGPR